MDAKTAKEIKKVAAELDERAHLGDQNAMGMIARVGELARRPGADERVKFSFGALAEVAKKRLGAKVKAHGEEDFDPIEAKRIPVVFILAAGPPICQETISGAILRLPDEITRTTFAASVLDPIRDRPLHYLPPQLRGIAHAAHCLGLAARYQRMLNGEPFSVYCPEMGWELGE